MPTNEELMEEMMTETTAVLRKVIAGKGKITANFYFTGTATTETALLILTLTTRDKKGQKSVAKGRDARRKFKTNKFAHGVVSFVRGKVDFEVVQGNAGPDLLKRAFKKNLAQRRGLALLRTARVHLPIDEEQPAPPEEPVDAAEDIEAAESELRQIEEETSRGPEKARIEQLVQEEASLDSALKAQRKHFLETDHVDDELEEIVEEQLKSIADLELSSDPDAPLQLAVARRKLVETLSTGPDPYHSEQLPPAVMQCFKGAFAKLGRKLETDLKRQGDQLEAYYKTISDNVSDSEWYDANHQAFRANVERGIRAVKSYRQQILEYLQMS